MTKIVYSPNAIADLEQIGDYIAETLKSPLATFNMVSKIQDSIDKLSDFPKLGSLLSSVTELDPNYRFLVSGNYLVFYRADTDMVYIDRILCGRRDYISVLFGDITEKTDE